MYKMLNNKHSRLVTKEKCSNKTRRFLYSPKIWAQALENFNGSKLGLLNIFYFCLKMGESALWCHDNAECWKMHAILKEKFPREMKLGTIEVESIFLMHYEFSDEDCTVGITVSACADTIISPKNVRSWLLHWLVIPKFLKTKFATVS